MSNCTITEDAGTHWLNVKGRIDSITSPEIQQSINHLIQKGQRSLVVDLQEVSYISSAGLRVFLAAQKQLMKAGGEICLFKPSDMVFRVFELGGVLRFFKIAHSREDLESIFHDHTQTSRLFSKSNDNLSVQYTKREVPYGRLLLIGSQTRLSLSEYTESDVITVPSVDVQFGCGLATFGDTYDDYKNFFGEAVLVNRSLFFYPAVKRPAVDFMLCTQGDSTIEYKFLHGFGFSGAYNYILSFESSGAFTELDRLVEMLFEISEANIFGMVILAESKGLWGMNLKNVPIIENKPANGKSIFDSENFSEWVNFPVEPSDGNRIITCVGVAVKNKNMEPLEVQELFAKDNNYHVHAGIFSQEPLTKKIDQFEHELERMPAELDVHKVQHALGQTRLSQGLVGIIELKG